jgi:hypothetical protein
MKVCLHEKSSSVTEQGGQEDVLKAAVGLCHYPCPFAVFKSHDIFFSYKAVLSRPGEAGVLKVATLISN